MRSIMYHYVRENSSFFPYSNHKEINNFINEINLIKKDNIFLTLEDLRKSNEFIEKSYLLTFDDGLKDHLNVAETLKLMNVRATFYIPIKPYLNKQILPVHKTHLICSKVGKESLELLKKACIELGIEINSLISNEEKIKYKSAYKHQNEETKIKEFKKIINYYGKIGLRDKLLDWILEKLGLKNVNYEKFYLTRNEIKHISSLGFEIGSHGVSHTLLSRLPYREQLSELKSSKEFLERIIGAKVTSFCFPYGGKSSYDKSTLEILRNLNYHNATSVESRDISQDDLKKFLFELPRYDCNEINKLLKI